MKVVVALGRAVAGCVMLCGIAAGASGAEEDTPPEFARLFEHPQQRQLVLEAVRLRDKGPPGACADAAYAVLDRVVVYRPARFDARGVPVTGTWKESVSADGCGARRILNVLVAVQSPGVLAIDASMLPGETIADPILQVDAARAALLSVAPSGCRDAAIADTRLVGADREPVEGSASAGRSSAPWREEWTVTACGERLTTLMSFVPQGNGKTGIVAVPGETGAAGPGPGAGAPPKPCAGAERRRPVPAP